MNNRIQISLFILLLLALGSQAPAQDEVYLKIQSEGYNKINLIIAPFRAEEQLEATEQIRGIMINDLTLSGFFNIIDAAQTIMALGDTGTGTQAITGAQVQASLSYRSDQINLKVLLSELPSQRKIFEKKFEGQQQSLRWLAHQASDEVVYYLVGERGGATTKIAFISQQGNGKELAVIDYDGAGFQRLTSSGVLNLSPRWSPQGDKIVFTSYIMDNPDLLILRLSDKKPYRISKEAGLNTSPAWSPDGKKIALTLSKDGNPEIYVMEYASRKLQRLTNHPAIESSPSWSPDGREIVFTSDRSGSPQLYLMDAQGGNIRRLTFEGSYNESPAWSPRGDRIAFVSRDNGRFHICTISVTGEDLLKLTDGPSDNENPCWSPNGLHIAFASNREGRWDIYVMNWNGTQLRKLTRTGGNTSPTWSPRLTQN
ncbi:MAG: Tol-Pal system beta propeller repeat protein TolB [candidate division KSB1 bacterium]|nr:Tol-Pal system beta propeller repeat protein TolB [candidate division KSB1 bacterium]MDZ7334983.1 Tol-Pal system beta propeller repeat protein TolB [candidate division KSB1 bacterium]MDZ7400208.1 Tol-Pal system beta propeller repeat protein TolB [candidate division KSB1 bacterium]